MGSVVKIYGAGISGLVAAINLARSGHRVSVIEKGKNIGGSIGWHPSVQFTSLNIEATSQFIGIDITPCFKKVMFQRRYLYKKRIKINPTNFYLCEKGPRASSIESFLYKMACSDGVNFYFDIDEDITKLKNKKNIIIATGLEKENYMKLGISYADIYGYKTLLETNFNQTYIDFFNKFTNYDLAYLAALNGITFILLFSRKGMNEKYLDMFRKFLSIHENIHSEDWFYSEGCIPCETNLVKDGLVLAGTISGMIDPFFANGIPGAFISGKIAADYLDDKKKAMEKFHNLTKSFRTKNLLKSVYNVVPLKQFLLPFFSAVECRLDGVGFV